MAARPADRCNLARHSTCRLLKHSTTRFCCAGCGQAFSSMMPFDAHRRQQHDGRRTCVEPGALLAKDGTPRFVTRQIPGVGGPVDLWGEPGRDSRWSQTAAERTRQQP